MFIKVALKPDITPNEKIDPISGGCPKSPKHITKLATRTVTQNNEVVETNSPRELNGLNLILFFLLGRNLFLLL